jgi:hypothetical protein
MAKEHERAERTNRALGKEAIGVNAAQDKSEGQGRASEKPSKRASAIRDFVAKLKKEGKCAFCGGSCDRCSKRDDLKCTHCGKKGHLAIVCASKALNLPIYPPKEAPKTYAKAVTGEETTDESASSITIATVAGFAPTPRVRLELGHGEVRFPFNCMPDSGASRTIIAYNVAKENGMKLDVGDKVNIRAANGERMPCEGAVTVSARLGRNSAVIRALVSSALRDEILLGWQEMVALKILTDTFPAPVSTVTQEDANDVGRIADEFPEVFEEETIKPMRGKPMKICWPAT